MSFAKLERYEAELAERRKARVEKAARAELKKAVKEVIPKSIRVPKRGRGRTPTGGVSRREVVNLRARADHYMSGEEGLRDLERDVKHTCLVNLLIDGVLGTEPWRASSGPHGGIIAANARVRYMENALRILADMRQGRGESTEPQNKLLEGVIDAEIVK